MDMIYQIARIRDYEPLVGLESVARILEKARELQGFQVTNINSTCYGGGVADHRVKVLQLTDAKEQTLELRVLASAADSSRAWDLRCEIREQLVEYLRWNYPGSLPRMRAELHPLFPANSSDEIKRGAILSAMPP